MTFKEKNRLVLAIDNLINLKMAGNSKDYYAKLGIARSTFFLLLEYMRDELKAPVIYDRVQKRFRYTKEGAMFLGFLSSDIITEEVLRDLKCGQHLKRSKKIF